MPVIESITYEEVLKALQHELQQAYRLSYIDDNKILIVSQGESEIIPVFNNYLIRLLAPLSGFVVKEPKIGNYYKNNYTVAIELWVKSSSKLVDRLISGNISVNKGIWEFFQDISDTLEHNTLDNQLHPYAGSNIGQPQMIKSDDNLSEGITFLWYGTQLNKK